MPPGNNFQRKERLHKKQRKEKVTCSARPKIRTTEPRAAKGTEKPLANAGGSGIFIRIWSAACFAGSTVVLR